MNTLTSLPHLRDLRLTKFYYLLLSGNGLILPYINLFYQSYGLNGTEMGIIRAVSAVAILLAAPFWARTTETTNHPRRLLQLALMLSAIAYILLGFQVQFLGIFIFTLIVALVNAAVLPLSDSLAMSVTGASRAGFGSVRIWMSFGWIFTVLFGAWIYENTNLPIWNFISFALLLIAGAILIWFIGAHYFQTTRNDDSSDLHFREVLHALRHNSPLLILAIAIMLIWSGNNGILQFEYVYMKNLGASKQLVGYAGILSAIVEIPCMLWADRLLRNGRLTSRQMLVVSFVWNAFWRGIIFMRPSVPMIMFQRAVAGVSYSFYAIALVNYIAEHTLPRQTRIAMAIYNVTLINLIGIVVSPVMGAIFDTMGGQWIYAISMMGNLLGAWVMWRVKQHVTTQSPVSMK